MILISDLVYDACLAFNIGDEKTAKDKYRQIGMPDVFERIAFKHNWLTEIQLKRLRA